MLPSQTLKLSVLVEDGIKFAKIGKSGLKFAVREVSKSRQKIVRSAVSQPSERGFICSCGSSFSRQGDLTRHMRFCDHEG